MTEKLRKKRGKSRIKDNNIRIYLTEMEMSQQELADLCSTNRAHINKLVNNKCNCISLPIAMKIAKALKQPVESVFTLED